MKVLLHKADNSLFGRVIRLRTQSQYTHAELLFANGDRFAIYSDRKATFYRVLPTLPLWDVAVWDCYEIPAGDSDELAVRAFCAEQVGTSYDWLGIILSQLFPWNRQHATKWFCSEVVVAALQAGGSLLLYGETPHQVSPGKLGKIFRDYGIPVVFP